MLSRTKLSLVILCFILIFMSIPNTAFAGGVTASVEPIELSAESAVLLETANNGVLFSKNQNERLPIASTTKIMTALIAIENCDMNKIVTVADEAIGVEGSSMYLYKGEKICMTDLVFALMLESANDAAVAIACEISGTVDAFAELMNAKAKELDLKDTSFKNPHGLDEDGHYSSAYDLAVLTSYALKNETFKEVVSTYRRVVPVIDGETTRLFLNHNKMLRQYDGAIGVKTGYTKESGRCLVSCAERDGVCLVAVTLNDPEDWDDHKKMLDSGFDYFELVELSRKNDEERTLPCVGGTVDTVTVTNLSAISAVVTKGDHDYIKKVEMKRFCYAPVKEGDVLGKVMYYEGKNLIAQADLVAVESVDSAVKKSFWELLLSIFK